LLLAWLRQEIPAQQLSSAVRGWLERHARFLLLGRAGACFTRRSKIGTSDTAVISQDWPWIEM
jgi:hypothetical protein